MLIILVTFGIFISKKLSLYEVLNIFQTTQDLPRDTIYLILTTSAENSDQYSDDEEDEAKPRNLSKLSARQLREDVELGKNLDSDSLLENNKHTRKKNTVISVVATSSKSTEDETSISNTRQNSRLDCDENWKTMTTISSDHAVFPEKNSHKYISLSPIKLFELFFDDKNSPDDCKSICLVFPK